ncbi:MAG: GNAT family N-acetyltransferase [Phycisphaerales bacterium]
MKRPADASTIVELETPRLLLRGLTPADAEAMASLCADREVARGTLTIPHPYTVEDAHAFIRECGRGLMARTAYHWGVAEKATGELVGEVGLTVNKEHASAEAGFLIGRAHWGHGYAPEALQHVMRWGFETLGLNRVHAHCMAWNEASARVMEKAGMAPEGVLKGAVLKWGRFEDVRLFGLTRAGWNELCLEFA